MDTLSPPRFYPVPSSSPSTMLEVLVAGKLCRLLRAERGIAIALTTWLMAALVCLALAHPVLAQDKWDQRLSESAKVLKATLETIPNDKFEEPQCFLIYPNVRMLSIVLGRVYGRGVLVCRGDEPGDEWGPPIMYKLDTLSFGAKFGWDSFDWVLLVMSGRGKEEVLSGKLRLGANATALAGASGAHASGDSSRKAEIRDYKLRKGGLIAGVAVDSVSWTTDDPASFAIYGKIPSAKEFDDGGLPVPPAAQPLIDVLKESWRKWLPQVPQPRPCPLPPCVTLPPLIPPIPR